MSATEETKRALLRDAQKGLREAIGTLEIAQERYNASGRGDRAQEIARALEVLDGIDLR